MKRCRLFQRAGLMDDGFLVGGPVRAAFQRIHIPARLGQHRSGEFHMCVLAGMGGTGKRQLAAAETIGVRGTTFHQRQGLHGLAGRTREDATFHISRGKQHAAIAIHHHRKAPVAAFHEIAPDDFDGNGIVHSLSLKKF